MSNNLTQRILGFDGIRGLAAIMVVLTHLNFWAFLTSYGIIRPAMVPMFHGLTGVQTFFVLSGFLITTILIKEQENTGTISIKYFFIRRILRIFPLYVLFLGIVTVIYFIDERVTSKTSLLFAYSYLYNFVPKSLNTSFLGHTWSLAVEEHFYLIWPFAFAYLFQKRRSKLIVLLWGFLFISPILHFWLVKVGVSKTYFVERWTFIAGYSICIGCVLAILVLSDSRLAIYQRFFGGYLSLTLSIFLFVFPAMVYGLSSLFDEIISGYLRCIGIAGGLVWLYCNQSSWVVRFLERQPIKYLGTISYGIYMYQGLFLATGPTRYDGFFWPPTQPIGFIALVISAPLSYHFFEKPFISLKAKFNINQKISHI